MKSYIVGVIFARGGSKSVPRKNIRLLAGKPLIAYPIETARKSNFIDEVIVSTDDHEIADVASQFGAKVPFIRPKELARDDSPEWLAWRHAVKEIRKSSDSPRMDIFVSLPPTSPLRSVEDVDICISTFLKSDADVVLTVKSTSRHPSFNMVSLDENMYARILMPSEEIVHRRQDAPKVYDMTTVAYVTRPDFILSADTLFQGKVKAVIIPEGRALDIDTEMDFAFAEFLLNRVNSA